MYGNETWTLYPHQERRLNNFYLRCILGITWRDRITNTAVTKRVQLPSLYSLLRQRRLRWLGHVRRMDDGRIPKDTLYAELSSGKRQIGRPSCVSRMSARMISGALALPLPTRWWQTLCRGLFMSEVTLAQHHEAKRSRRKRRQQSTDNKTPEHQHLQGQPSNAKSVVENVFQTSDFTVTGGAVTSGAHKNFIIVFRD